VISAVNKNNSLELKDVEKQGDWRAVIALKK
jgi:hypothetical protein